MQCYKNILWLIGCAFAKPECEVYHCNLTLSKISDWVMSESYHLWIQLHIAWIRSNLSIKLAHQQSASIEQKKPVHKVSSIQRLKQ